MAELDDLKREVAETDEKFVKVIEFIQGIQVELVNVKVALQNMIEQDAADAELRAGVVAEAGKLDELQARMDSIITPPVVEEPSVEEPPVEP